MSEKIVLLEGRLREIVEALERKDGLIFLNAQERETLKRRDLMACEAPPSIGIRLTAWGRAVLAAQRALDESDLEYLTPTKIDIHNLRELTGYGLLDCRDALSATGCDMDKASQWLRTRWNKALKVEEGGKEGMSEQEAIDGFSDLAFDAEGHLKNLRAEAQRTWLALKEEVVEAAVAEAEAMDDQRRASAQAIHDAQRGINGTGDPLGRSIAAAGVVSAKKQARCEAVARYRAAQKEGGKE